MAPSGPTTAPCGRSRPAAAAGPPSPPAPLRPPAIVVTTPLAWSIRRIAWFSVSTIRMLPSGSIAISLCASKTAASGRPPIAGIGRFAGAGEGGDRPVRGVDAADPAVQPVGYEDIAAPVDRDAVGLVQRGPQRRTAVPSKARRAIAGDRCDDAAPRIDPADA